MLATEPLPAIVRSHRWLMALAGGIPLRHRLGRRQDRRTRPADKTGGQDRREVW